MVSLGMDSLILTNDWLNGIFAYGD
uniref:Uncharacterized protein n=1 Tax=Anguilla anguilla TaxID=7936 RepID=A0A0E9VK62_ANGAN